MTMIWKCLISRFVDKVITRQQLHFSFPELWHNLLEFKSRKIANISWTEQNEISMIKFEAWLHFLSDAFVAVAVVVA